MKIKDILNEAIKLSTLREKQYGKTYEKVGDIFKILFPSGIELKTAQDHERYHLLAWIFGKLARYSENLNKDIHTDSIFDAVVYSAILTTIDFEKNNKENNDNN